MRKRDNCGIHIIADLYGCNIEKLMRINDIKRIMEDAVKEAGLTKIKSHFHQFKPWGITGFILLSESHLSIHTWPEYGYVSLDIYGCGPEKSSFYAYNKILHFFKPRKVFKNVFVRGDINEASRAADIKTIS